MVSTLTPALSADLDLNQGCRFGDEQERNLLSLFVIQGIYLLWQRGVLGSADR